MSKLSPYYHDPVPVSDPSGQIWYVAKPVFPYSQILGIIRTLDHKKTVVSAQLEITMKRKGILSIKTISKMQYRVPVLF
jgi:hypothetical protein